MAKVKGSKGDIIFDVFNYTILTILLLLVLYPLYFIVIASISDPTAVNNGKVLIRPIGITFEGYAKIFDDSRIWLAYFNTIVYTVVGTAINVILTMMVSYALSRRVFFAKKFVMIFLMITMYFNGGLIPTYLLVKQLGLVNKWPVMILLSAVNVFNVIVAKNYMENNIPEELYEAASIDGCSQIKYFIKIVLPLSKTIMAVLVLYYGVAHWNEFMTPLIYLRNEKLYPLQLILRSILVQNQIQGQMVGEAESLIERQKAGELIKYGVIIVSTLPILIIYPILQKYFVKGTMVGSIKG